ncbi:hypothetical protein MUG10_14505 [Xanthomonas prunicola]|uniref:RHS repeat protein n=1 Tax=Xanthomonas prunicola TaxID=2053930 RepID=A0A9Q9IWE7_9XANT|nr:hypothetical protein [Xanthomonas prunicola]USI99289.1 hypothetical protein MUG10_14505 [Xanthomonas prunicola]UXA56173.1 hypothetical protein M0D47_15295 [Xanthomonas prunicola]UXA64344.1 hypothetical protein M0D43_15465 [Xanthomonas prunicola]
MGLGYDAQGNLTNKNGQAYSFTLGNQLRSVVGKQWYAYDGYGRRVIACGSGACNYQLYSQADASTPITSIWRVASWQRGRALRRAARKR